METVAVIVTAAIAVVTVLWMLTRMGYVIYFEIGIYHAGEDDDDDDDGDEEGADSPFSPRREFSLN